MDRAGADRTGTLAERTQFDRLWREHGDTIYRFCLRRTQDAELAEDARSTVFFEAWRRRREVDLRGRAALPWLYGVAANVLRNQRRSLRRREDAIRRVPPPRAHVDSVDDIADRVDASASAALAMQVLCDLPPGERAVVILCIANELSYADAADALDLPVGTVRSRLFRARARLHAGVNP